ncbi:hypothetical protein ACFL2Y_01035 [Candidatus Omnitrophota bacterium]
MKKLLFAIILSGLVVSFGYCQEAEEQPLTLTISSDKEVYEVGEEIVLEITLKNNSDKEMISFWTDKKPDIFTEEMGVYIVAMYIQLVDETLYIKPKENLTRDVAITLDEKMKPVKGRIGIQFLYNTQNIILNFKHKSDQEIFTGTLTSNTITIEVVEVEGNVADRVISWLIGYNEDFSEQYHNAEIMKSKKNIYLVTDVLPSKEYDNIKIIDKDKMEELIKGSFDKYGIINISKTRNTNEYRVNAQIGNQGRSVYRMKIEGNKITVQLLAQS